MHRALIDCKKPNIELFAHVFSILLHSIVLLTFAHNKTAKKNTAYKLVANSAKMEIQEGTKGEVQLFKHFNSVNGLSQRGASVSEEKHDVPQNPP